MDIKKGLIFIIALMSCSFSDISGYAPFIPLLTPKTQGYNQKPLTLSTYESQKFAEHIETRLPDYEQHFKLYSMRYQVPWTLIAAVAYQESKWNDEAISHTGVRGLMQLTTKTAQHLGIEDREDPYQSIKGGAYYLKYLYDKTPASLKVEQRWTLALAAYNIGWGHIRDARVLSKQLKKNPYKWSDLKMILPLLEDLKYYSQLSFGYARGNETVDFVDKVLSYYNLLNINLNPHKQIADRAHSY